MLCCLFVLIFSDIRTLRAIVTAMLSMEFLTVMIAFARFHQFKQGKI